tara:strand:- start:2089 stop:2658 length:570 start_codon:yes stop_codon:yes gene_type:complete
MKNLIEQKKDLRRLSAAKRVRMSPHAARQVADVFRAITMPSDAAIVSGYHPIGSELDPRPLLATLHSQGHEIALPVVVERGAPLVFRVWREGDSMSEGTFGVREPLPEASEVRPDVLLVPMLAFDRQGFRLGYGGGFYDRTLALLRQDGSPVAIGIAFAAQEVDRVPVAEYDQPLNWIVTEREAIETGG